MRRHWRNLFDGKRCYYKLKPKEGINTRSSMESEIGAADDVVSPMIWTRQFLEALGYIPESNIMLQDNQSAMKLEINEQKSVGKRTRHLNIRLFSIKDQQAKKDIDITFCPTDRMLADYFIKPLLGAKFKQYRQEIMNLPIPAQMMMRHCMHTDHQSDKSVLTAEQ